MASRVPLAVAALAVSAVAQCAPSFSNGVARAGVDGEILTSAMWDPDGPGPLAERLVVGGAFGAAGAVVANCIAVFDLGSGQWQSLGSGLTSTWGAGAARVHALVATPTGELYAGGSFTHAGGTPVGSVARWNGTAWQPLGNGVSGFDFSVLTLARLPNGDIVAGGSFDHAGGVPAVRIARWDGAQWHALGTGVPGAGPAFVRSLLVRASGELIVGGQFSAAGGVPCSNVAQWNGAAWSSLGDATAWVTDIRALVETPSGLLIAGGSLGTSSSSIGISALSGTTWGTYGTNLSFIGGNRVRGLRLLPNGTLLALRETSGVASCVSPSGPWTSPTLWAQLNRPAIAEPLPGGDIVISGRTNPNLGSARVDGIARWNGFAWSSLAPAIDGAVLAGVGIPGGYVIGGHFMSVGGVAASRIARWDGTAWHALGSGCNGVVSRLARMPNGDVIAIGAFTSAGGVAVDGLAAWNGTSWSSIGGGPGSVSSAMTIDANGGLIVHTAAGLQRWDGSVWTTFGGVAGVQILELRASSNGDLFAGGVFTWCGLPANRIARWDGVQWHALGTGLSGALYSMTVAPNGDLFVSGDFWSAGGVPANQVARWDGTTWHALGLGFDVAARALEALPDGTVLATRPLFAGGVTVDGLARWNGSAWIPVGTGLRPVPFGYDLAPLDNGAVLVCGEFGRAGPLAAGGVVELLPGCASGAAPIATDCLGPAGPIVAAGLADPRIGMSFVSHASGCASNAIAAAVFGFQPALLRWFNIGAMPGCDLLAAPDVVAPMLPAGGVATHTLPVPASPTLVGAVLWHQFVHVSPASFGPFDLAFSNGLVLTIGP